MDAERERLEACNRGIAWKRWGPYLSERQWGTVREDYSENGDAWNHFSHDQARSRAYRWGEDGLAGVSDDGQRLCFALALWNGKDPILKERVFGLTNSEGNHGEDPKEYWFYLDSTPTHSYMKWLYKYPQRAYPYDEIVRRNRERSRKEPEYELVDTGVFDDGRYWDVFVEYGKAAPDDLLVKVTVANRGPDEATLHVLPHLWFRNTWSWSGGTAKPVLRAATDPAPGTAAIAASHADLGSFFLSVEGTPELLFTENESNLARLAGIPNRTPYVKDAFHAYLVHGRREAVNPERTGTKAAADCVVTVPAGGETVLRLRLSNADPAAQPPFGDGFDQALADRLREADFFYESITPDGVDRDHALVLRQALAGMLWTKQFYDYDVDQWLSERGSDPFRSDRKPAPRNANWYHMVNADVISMPDKWEYPWYAAWDLAFHAIALQMVDPDFAKGQLELMLREHYLHPNGQIPAYEWNFGDVNPPVHAWATLFTYQNDRLLTGRPDVEFLKGAFQKLMLNFTWWVNRKDPSGMNVFEGGFLGLDNIGVFDRSSALPTGGSLEQADGTAWMAFFSQNMLEIALELATYDPVYEGMANKFLEHFLFIASAMDRIGLRDDEMWDEEDGFFYDLLRLPDGSAKRLKVRSMVGLLPLCASTVYGPETAAKVPRFVERAAWLVKKRPELLDNIAPIDRLGHGGRRLLAIVDETKLRRILARMLDPGEFLSDYGIRALSKAHLADPYRIRIGGKEFSVGYLPAESDSGMFGGNSNWRGPIWMPVNVLLIRALLNLYGYYGDELKVECPTGSGRLATLFEVAREIATRLSRIFLRGPDGRRPVFGGTKLFQEDPHWRDHLQFHEYFHGDDGAGIGAPHQTGWTGLVAKLIQLFGSVTAAEMLEAGTIMTMPYRE
ncbi:MAG: glucosidase [Thermoanaerobaculia bacterium]